MNSRNSASSGPYTLSPTTRCFSHSACTRIWCWRPVCGSTRASVCPPPAASGVNVVDACCASGAQLTSFFTRTAPPPLLRRAIGWSTVTGSPSSPSKIARYAFLTLRSWIAIWYSRATAGRLANSTRPLVSRSSRATRWSFSAPVYSRAAPTRLERGPRLEGWHTSQPGLLSTSRSSSSRRTHSGKTARSTSRSVANAAALDLADSARRGGRGAASRPTRARPANQAAGDRIPDRGSSHVARSGGGARAGQPFACRRARHLAQCRRRRRRRPQLGAARSCVRTQLARLLSLSLSLSLARGGASAAPAVSARAAAPPSPLPSGPPLPPPPPPPLCRASLWTNGGAPGRGQ